MSVTLPEIKSPIASARLIGDNVSYEEYSHQLVERGHPDYVVGRSDLLDILHCPHKWRMGYQSEETDATDWGQLFETLVMYRAQLNERFAIPPATYQSTGMKCPSCGSVTDAKSCRKCGLDRKPVTIEKPWDFNATPCAQWKEEQGKKQIVKRDTLTQAENAVKFFWGKRQLSDLVRCSQKQVMVEGSYVDKETGIRVPLRGLIDFVPDQNNPDYGQCLADLKTTRSADPHSWAKDVYQYGLHVQGALYLDLYNAAVGREGRIDFRHAISESGPPWETACRILSQDFITLGRDTYIRALELYCQCLKTDEWPGYDTEANGTFWQGWLITDLLPWMIKA